MLGRNRATFSDAGALLLLAALSVGFLWKCNLGGRAMVPGDLLLIMEPGKHYSRQFPEFKRVGNPILDAIQQFYPWRKFAGESLRAGEIPFWNPYELCGNPFVGNNQSAVFYPETWLHAVMPAERALGWATSMYFFCAGALMYWFLRVIGLRRAACLLGAIAFMFNGFGIGWLCFPSFRSVPAWLPGMLVGLELMLRGRRSVGMAVLAACTGLQFLAGNLHISLFVLIVFAAYAAFRCITAWRNGDRQLARVTAMAAVGALGIGGALSAAQLIPTLELARLSSRAGALGFDQIRHNALAPQALLTGLMPDLFGNPVDYNHWGAELGKTYRAYTESTFYVGLAPVLLLPLGFISNRRETTFWLGVVIVGALLATGTHLNAALYYLIPQTRSLSGIGRAVVMMSTGVSILGAYGLHALLELSKRSPEQIARRVVIAGGALGLIGLIAGLWVWMATGAFEIALPGIGAYTLNQLGRFAVFLVVGCIGAGLMARNHRLGAALIIASLVFDLFIYVDKFTPAVNPEYLHINARCIETIKAAPGNPRILSLGEDGIRRMAANTPMIAGLEDIQGSDSLEIGQYRRLWKAICKADGDFPQPDPSLPAIDLLGVGFVHSSVPLSGPDKLKLVSDYDGYLYENIRALPRAFSVPRARVVSPEAALKAVASADFDPTAEVLLSGKSVGGRSTDATDLEAPSGDASAPPTPDLPAIRCVHETNTVRISGQFAPGRLVVIADTFFPGWRAYQGDEELPIRQADYALRAVYPTREAEDILLVYVPGSGSVGMFLTLLALGIIAGLGVWSKAARRAAA